MNDSTKEAIIRKAALICAGVIAFALSALPASAHHNRTHWQYQYKAWLPAVWQRIAHCEGGTRPPADPNWKHNSGTYQGAFGFHYGSWDRFNTFGYPREAYLATPWQQYRVALAIHARYGFTGWGCYMNNSWVRYG